MLKAWGILVFCVVLVFLVRNRFAPATFDLPNPIEAQYRPGKTVRGLSCEYPYWSYQDLMECYRGDYYFSWDYHTGVVSHTGKMVASRPIGDYILSWGTPVGQKIWGLCRYIYWTLDGDSIAVMICGKNINPDTPVTYVMMSSAPGEFDSWSGFRFK